jgi:hypothetical protein
MHNLPLGAMNLLGIHPVKWGESIKSEALEWKIFCILLFGSGHIILLPGACSNLVNGAATPIIKHNIQMLK